MSRSRRYEAIAVSTCNRTELYLVGHDAARLAEVGIAELRAIAGEHDLVADEAFFVYRGERAAQHVYRVAAGLDAVVKGEAEVLGQVREALALARVESRKKAVEAVGAHRIRCWAGMSCRSSRRFSPPRISHL